MNTDDEAAKSWWNQEKKKEKTGFIVEDGKVIPDPENETEEEGYPCQTEGCNGRTYNTSHVRCEDCRTVDDHPGHCVCGSISLPYAKWCMPCFVRERDKNGLPALDAKTIYDVNQDQCECGNIKDLPYRDTCKECWERKMDEQTSVMKQSRRVSMQDLAVAAGWVKKHADVKSSTVITQKDIIDQVAGNLGIPMSSVCSVKEPELSDPTDCPRCRGVKEESVFTCIPCEDIIKVNDEWMEKYNKAHSYIDNQVRYPMSFMAEKKEDAPAIHDGSYCGREEKAKEKNMLAMAGFGDLAMVNKMIACVDVLYADDGREIHVQDWNPSVPLDGVISVTCKGLIFAKDKDGNMEPVIPNSSSRHTLKKINICPVNMTSKDGREFGVLLTFGGKPPEDGEEWNPDHLQWNAPMKLNVGLVVNFTAVICMDQEKKD